MAEVPDRTPMLLLGLLIHTENVYSLQHWCNNNCPAPAEQLEGLYKDCGIPTDLNYIE